MLTSTPKKAVSSESSLIECLICAEPLENNQRIAVSRRSQWDLRGTISNILGGELQPTCKGSQYVCKKKCFPRLIKVEKIMSSLKTLQDELREEVSQKNAVRMKRGLSEEVSVAPSFEAARNVKSPMKSINKTLFPSNATPAVQIIGYQTLRPSVPVVVRAFPNYVNTWHHTKNGAVNNQLAVHHQLTNHINDWDSAQCLTYSTNYFRRLTLESWYTNLEQTPLDKCLQLPASYKRLIHNGNDTDKWTPNGRLN